MKIEVTMNIDVSDEDILSMIETAGYGIGYWAEWGVVDEKARTYTITPNEEARFDEQYAKDFTIGFDDIVRVLVQIAMGDHEVGYPREYAREWFDELKKGNKYAGAELDTDIMDVAIQIACFGEVIFG